MLEQILDFIHNYFVHEVYRGKFVIAEGSIVLPDLQDGQYIKICKSVFNDGVHKFPDDELHDEVFAGEVWALAIPPAILSLADEVDAWVEKYGNQASSPFQSESFGGYSYTKASGSSADGSGGVSWQSVFGSRLNAYRKII